MKDALRKHRLFDTLGFDASVPSLDGARGKAAKRGKAARLVDENVRRLLDDHGIATMGLCEDRDQVPHRAAENQHRRLLAKQLGGPLLERLDGGIVVIIVVTDFRVVHCTAHLG